MSTEIPAGWADGQRAQRILLRRIFAYACVGFVSCVGHLANDAIFFVPEGSSSEDELSPEEAKKVRKKLGA